MAAEKPIVSTPIRDVAEPYGELVYLGDTAERLGSPVKTTCDVAQQQCPAQLVGPPGLDHFAVVAVASRYVNNGNWPLSSGT